MHRTQAVMRAFCSGALGAIGSIALATAVFAQDASAPIISVRGFLDARGIVTASTQGWQDRGLGKTRFGGDSAGNRRTLGKIAEADLVAQARLTWDLAAIVAVSAAPEQRTAIDLQEAYLQYKPAPTGTFGVRLRAGLFFPPISEENTGLAWTSPYTITPSAINSWVGEELRTLGGELMVSRHVGDLEIAATGAVFKNNDPAGTLLAWRGWSFNDRATGYMDRLRIPIVRIIRPNGILSRQEPFDEPYTEIDGRLGYYAGASVASPSLGKLALVRYDNRADDHPFQDGQWSWNTSFWNLGLSSRLPGDVDLIVQGMAGRTTLITTPVGPIVDTRFRSVYGLVSKLLGRHRISLRADLFDTRDRDIFPDNNNEHGYSLTLAYIFRPTPKQRLTLELLYIDSDRAERQFIGLPIRARESQFQISYRLFL